VTRKWHTLVIILHYNHLPVLLLNFKRFQADLKEYT